MQATRLLQKTLQQIRSIGYKFIWDGCRGASWSKILQGKEEGGLGICDFMLMDKAAAIKDANTLWENGGSVWVAWKNYRYIRGQAMEDIHPKKLNSTNWSLVLVRKAKIGRCVSLG